MVNGWLEGIGTIRVEERERAQPFLVCSHVARHARRSGRAHSQRDLEGFGNFSRNLLLDVEDVLERAVVTVGATGDNRSRRSRAQGVTRTFSAAFRTLPVRRLSNCQHLADRPQVFVPTLEVEGRRASVRIREMRECGIVS